MVLAKDTEDDLLGFPVDVPETGAEARRPVMSNEPTITATWANRFTVCDMFHSNDESSHPQR
jgi:hypothetical protein